MQEDRITAIVELVNFVLMVRERRMQTSWSNSVYDRTLLVFAFQILCDTCFLLPLSSQFAFAHHISLYFSFYLSISLSLSLSVALCLCVSYAHAHALSLSVIHTHTLSHSLSLYLSQSAGAKKQWIPRDVDLDALEPEELDELVSCYFIQSRTWTLHFLSLLPILFLILVNSEQKLYFLFLKNEDINIYILKFGD